MRMLSVSDQLSPILGYKLYAKPSGMCSNIFHGNKSFNFSEWLKRNFFLENPYISSKQIKIL